MNPKYSERVQGGKKHHGPSGMGPSQHQMRSGMGIPSMNENNMREMMGDIDMITNFGTSNFKIHVDEKNAKQYEVEDDLDSDIDDLNA
jgi:hypothetical protein